MCLRKRTIISDSDQSIEKFLGVEAGFSECIDVFANPRLVAVGGLRLMWIQHCRRIATGKESVAARDTAKSSVRARLRSHRHRYWVNEIFDQALAPRGLTAGEAAAEMPLPLILDPTINATPQLQK